MSVRFRLPHIAGGTDGGKVEQVRRYLFALVEQLNLFSDEMGKQQETQQKALKALENAAEIAPEREVNTGWIDLGFSADVLPATEYGNYGHGPAVGCSFRVENGNHVYVAFNCAFTYGGSEIYVAKNQIPERYRPKRMPYALCGCNNRHVAWVHVSTAGRVVIDAVQAVASAERTTSAAINWIDGYIDYFV